MKLEKLVGLLEENDGRITLGKIEIFLSEPNSDGNVDIDFRYGGTLIQWIGVDSSNEEGNYTFEDGLLGTAEKLQDEKSSNEELLKKIEELNSALKIQTSAIGKVEAYEKILIGRDFTVSA